MNNNGGVVYKRGTVISRLSAFLSGEVEDILLS